MTARCSARTVLTLAIATLAVFAGPAQAGVPDELFLFSVTDLFTQPAEGSAIASITDLGFTQSAFDTATMWDSNNAITDEIRFGTTFVDAIGNLVAPPLLTLQVNTITGETTLLGDSSEANDINFYEITSAANSLDADNWFSLTDQDFEGSGPPDGSGNGWEEAGGVGAHALAEAFLLGNSTIGVSQSVSLGEGYDVGVGTEDLEFTYRTDTGEIIEGLIEYVPLPIPGDANHNGFVDDTDLAIQLGNWEQDPLIISRWEQGNFTETGFGDTDVDDIDLAFLLGNWTGPPPAGASVPEPVSAVLLLIGAPVAALRRRRR